jgi:hypothetical protein
LLALTAGLLNLRRIAPNPALDAVNALCRFGSDLPASAVDPVLELLAPILSAGSALTSETVNLLIQLYWAVAAMISPRSPVLSSGHDDPPPYLWEMVGKLPSKPESP